MLYCKCISTTRADGDSLMTIFAVAAMILRAFFSRAYVVPGEEAMIASIVVSVMALIV